MSMFCYQCEQTAKSSGCTMHGVCGKDPEVAALQDLLVAAIKDIACCAHRARELGKKNHEIDAFVPYAAFTTLTNTNFSTTQFQKILRKASALRVKAMEMYEAACKEAEIVPEDLGLVVPYSLDEDLEKLVSEGRKVSIEARIERHGADVAGLQETIVYGVKGASAYIHHAGVLGQESDAVYAMTHELLAYVAGEPTDLEELTGMAMKAGTLNLKAMELLDAANTGAYGHPEPTQVRVTPVKGKCILVSGHDLKDLEALLKQTEGKGINVYTHGEMLPANAYPELKKHTHLAGNYGGAWQDQQREFSDFPGAILMTTNCLMKPHKAYEDRIFTCGPAGWEGVPHLTGENFGPVIEKALSMEGFAEDAPEKSITIGFGRNAVLGVADKVIEAVKGGAIKHFFLIGGCDGAKPGRNYYTKLAESVPDDCVILTLACGKYRFNKLEFGDIGGIPRLLDVGQCNDSYSAVQIALALADAFGTDVNSLPLSMILSWYEQKAVAILLTLLSLGVKDIKLGPTLPAFVSPTVLNVLVEQFNIAPVSEPEKDLQEALAG